MNCKGGHNNLGPRKWLKEASWPCFYEWRVKTPWWPVSERALNCCIGLLNPEKQIRQQRREKQESFKGKLLDFFSVPGVSAHYLKHITVTISLSLRHLQKAKPKKGEIVRNERKEWKKIRDW